MVMFGLRYFILFALFALGMMIDKKLVNAHREPRPFHCTAPVPIDVVAAKVMVVCEDLAMNITCSGEETIAISDAVYGRLVKGTVACPHPRVLVGTTSNTNCQSNETSKVREKCDGKSSCSIGVNNGVFGDPCSGTYKYLNVTYKCT